MGSRWQDRTRDGVVGRAGLAWIVVLGLWVVHGMGLWGFGCVLLGRGEEKVVAGLGGVHDYIFVRERV